MLIVYGPAKSCIIPLLKAIPVCPINGKIHVINGRGVHTILKGNLASYALISASSEF